MPNRPLILFADPIPVDKARRHGGPSDFYIPPHEKQVERLSPKFEILQKALDAGTIRVTKSPDGSEPEYTLVLEVAGDPSGFETAIKHTNGIEWFFEVSNSSVPNTDDFHRLKNSQRDDTKEMTFKYFCILTNQAALKEILSLWKAFKNNANTSFPYGQAGLRNVFKTLNDIHLWGITERLEETDILTAWKEDLTDSNLPEVRCEIELFYRKSAEKREKAMSTVIDHIEKIGGVVISTSCIEEIAYHAILASIPRQYAEQVVQHKNIDLVQLDQIMFFKPTGQSKVLGTDDGMPFNRKFNEPTQILDEPIVALFDGLPQEQHPLLSGFLSIDDPDDYTASYQIKDRQHGTSMASLIARGDLSCKSESIISHKIYVRPIMKPFPAARGTQEYIPDDTLIVDKIHEAVRRMYEPTAGRVASNVRIINLSIGIGSRMYYNMVSPLARLLDWLSFKYRVLFIVSAGNHADNIDLGISFHNYKNLSLEERDRKMVQILDQNSRKYRLLSPAESINALTVGALFKDESDFKEEPWQILPCSNRLPSPISSMGRGINNSIKPDIIYDGGRSVLREDVLNKNHAYWQSGTNKYPPGTLSAKPLTISGDTTTVGFSFGTSNSAALISHEASSCYDTLDEIFRTERSINVPSQYGSLIIKAMLVHGAKWNSSAKLICHETGLPGRGADQIHKWMGYGVPDFSKVHECAKNRVTLIGYGELAMDSACLYSLPLPFDFSIQKMYRCLTVTLASFSSIRPSSQKYRSSQLWFSLETNGKNLQMNRIDADDKAVARGTLQHERFEGDGAIVWGENDVLHIKVNCRADASKFDEKIPYAILVTFELAPELNISVYDKVVNKIKDKDVSVYEKNINRVKGKEPIVP